MTPIIIYHHDILKLIEVDFSDVDFKVDIGFYLINYMSAERKCC